MPRCAAGMRRDAPEKPVFDWREVSQGIGKHCSMGSLFRRSIVSGEHFQDELSGSIVPGEHFPSSCAHRIIDGIGFRQHPPGNGAQGSFWGTQRPSQRSARLQPKKNRPPKRSVFCRNWQRPTFPGSLPPSIIGAEELNYCVRDGNRCNIFAIATRYSFR